MEVLGMRSMPSVGWGKPEGGEPAATLPGIDGPDVLDAESSVVVDALLKVTEGLVSGEDLDAKRRGEADDGI